MTTVTYERGPADIGFISSYYNSLRTIEEMAVANGTVEDPAPPDGARGRLPRVGPLWVDRPY